MQVGFSSEHRYQIAVDDSPPRPDQALPREQQQATLRQHKEELMQVRDALQQHPAVQQASLSNYLFHLTVFMVPELLCPT